MDLPFTDEEPKKPAGCLGCPLYDAPGPVFGPPAQPNTVLFLGEAPGKDEVILEQMRLRGKYDKNPNFQGGAGRVLYRWCGQVGIVRDAHEVRNVVKCRPTLVNNTGRTVDRAPTEEEIRHCAIYLSKELATIRPNLIVALGETATYTTTGLTKITKQRGRVIEGPLLRKREGVDEEDRRVKVLPIYHPAFIMRQQELWPLSVFDLAKAKKEKMYAEIRRHPVEYRFDGALRCSVEDYVAAARAAGFVVFDLEAEGILGRRGKGLDLNTGAITIMGLTTRPYFAEAFDWTPDVQRLFLQLAADPSIEKVGQNSEGFDIPYCEKKSGANFQGPSYDTLQAFHLIHPEFEKNLDFMSSLYTDMESWKGPKMYKSGHEALKKGNCCDIDSTCRTYLETKSELKSLGMLDLYYNGVMPLQPVLRRMRDRGLKRNEVLATTMGAKARAAAVVIEKKLHGALGHDTNFDSPQQLRKLLYDQMGLPVQYKKDKKRGLVPTVDDNALDNLAKETNNPIFVLIHKRRKFLKFDSTFISGIETDDDGFVHYNIGSAKAATEEGKDEFGREKGSGARNGRLVSWNPNFQNQPNEVRELYIPDTEEHVLIEADWSQIEWRNSMVLSGEPYGLELLAKGVDNHSYTAAECFGLTLDEVAKRDAEHNGGWGSPRFETKFIVYGLTYGRGAADIAKQLGQPISWVDAFIARFRTRFSVYWNWKENLPKQVEKNSYLANAFGRRRWWYTRQATEVYNFPPSSTAADMMYRVLPQIERQMPNGATLRLTVHDSVLVNSPKDVAKRAAECLRDIMHTKWDRIVEYSARPDVVRRYYPTGWHCPCDVHVGSNWRECKKGNRALEQKLGVAA